jgi:CubicO group peptidase (beta-lactamase class C family)
MLSRGLLAAAMFTSSAAAQLPVAAPESQGMASDRLARIGAVMKIEIDKGTMPGAVTLIARNGRIVHFEAHGFLDNGKTRPMPKDAVFRAFSMTKPFVSVAAMMMVEQGRFQLRDPITNLLPELKDLKVIVEKRDASGNVTRDTEPAARPITVQDLLRHTSGFTYAATAPYPEIRDAYNKLDIEGRETDISPDEFIKRLATVPLAYQPGTRWEYGISTDVLGVLLERAAGKPLHVLLDEMIFKPLKMKDTGFQVTAEQLPRLADAFDSDPQKAGLWKWVRVEADPAKRYRLGLPALCADDAQRRRTGRRAAAVQENRRIHAVRPHSRACGLAGTDHRSRLRLRPRLRYPAAGRIRDCARVDR